MIITRVEQYFKTLNTSSEAMTMPMVVLKELFDLKNIFKDIYGYNFLLFTPENSPPNSFGMTVARNDKALVLFGTPPEDPVALLFHNTEQLGCNEETIKILESRWDTMLEGKESSPIFKQQGSPWWFFLWR
jgi:hypothetical protein